MLIAGPATPTIIESAERTEAGQASKNANTRKPAGKVIVVLFIHSPVGFRTFHFSMYEEDGMMHGCATALYLIPIIGQISIDWPDYSNCVKTPLLLVSS